MNEGHHIYLVAYDITEPKRWRKIYKILKNHGVALQYSVFRCSLLPEEQLVMVHKLLLVAHLREDKLLVADLGGRDTRGRDAIVIYGEAVPDITRGPIIL